MIHAALGFILLNSDFIDRVNNHMEPREVEEFNGTYWQSQAWLRRLDGNATPGGVLLLGDSHLQSLDLAGMGRHVLNYAVSGETTARLLERIGDWRAPKISRVVFLAVGINDFSFRDHDEIVANYTRVLSHIPDDKSLVLGLVFPVDERVQSRTTNQDIAALNDAILGLCAERRKCRTVDASSALTDETGNLRGEYHSGDGLHLSAAGYAIWREALRPAFEAITG
jgi:lysophospholipase L1-like esterase